MNDIRAYTTYSSDPNLQGCFRLVWDYFSDCRYKENWKACEQASISFTVNANRTITLRSFKEMDRLFEQHPRPEKLHLHTHWKARGEVIRFMVTAEPSVLVVSVQSDDPNLVAGVHERVKGIFKASGDTPERSPDPRRTQCRKSVFVAHRFDDTGRATSATLCTFLRRLGFSVSEGEGYQANAVPDKVAERIMSQDIFLCLVTPGDPSWLQTEAGFAKGKGKYIILLIQEGEPFNKGIVGADYEHMLFPKGTVEKAFNDLLYALPY